MAEVALLEDLPRSGVLRGPGIWEPCKPTYICIYIYYKYMYISSGVYIYKYITCQMKGSIIYIYIFTIYRDHFVINRLYIYISILTHL